MAIIWIACFLLYFQCPGSKSEPYYGVKIGKFITHFHNIQGDVYTVDDKTMFVKGFHYDGKGPDAYFWAGTSSKPDTSGFIVSHNKESSNILEKSDNQDMILQLPDDMKIEDIRWLSVWSKKFLTSFGYVIFPETIVPPRPVLIGPLRDTSKGVSTGNILILDSQTFLIPDFNYDGSGKGVYWWLSKDVESNMDDIKLLEEDGRDSPVKEHIGKTVVIILPDGHSVLEYNVLSLRSLEDNEDYGSVELPTNLNIPPSPRNLGLVPEQETNKLNCEMLNDNLSLQVKWAIQRNDIIIHLTGNVGKLQYMALGLSKDDTETKFDASDAIVAWLDENGRGHVEDYFLESIEKCENGHGMCPDISHQGSKNNIEMVNTTISGNTTTIVLKRPLKAEDQVYDQNIYTDGPQAILWAVGSIQNENFVESPKFRSRGNLLLDFGRDPIWNCPQTNENEIQVVKPKHVFEIHCPSDRIFRAQLGPAEHYRKELVWYINGLPTPDLTVQRGESYTFIVEGGNTPNKRHPFYITDSSDGGYLLKASEGSKEEFFAGVVRDSNTNIFFPTVEGRLCEWKISVSDPEDSINLSSSESTQPLTLICEFGTSKNLTWTPDSKTPNTVYYQSFTEKNFGGKIKVVDFCEETNPSFYLENEFREIHKPSLKGYRSKPGVEREDLFSESEEMNPSKNQKEFQEKELENNESKEVKDLHYAEFENTSDEKPESIKTLMMTENWKRTDYSESSNPEKNLKELENSSEETQSNSESLDIDQHFSTDSDHPHDESERSDRNVHHQHLRLENTIRKGEIPPKAIASNEDLASSQLSVSHTSIQSLSPASTKQQQGFKPHFEGGFIPLVLNPIKERELQLPQFPSSSLRRPHRPFLFNESIPFHGTFKPGVPDFSGFNISSYSQEESNYPVNHVQDNIPMLSAPKPQMVQNQISPINLQAELFKRQKRPMQHQYVFHPPPRPRNQFLHAPSHGSLLNLHISNVRDELEQVSSQRVQVALQSIKEDKNNQGLLPPFHTRPMQNRNQKPHNLIHSPPIQRRPDIVDGEVPSNMRPFQRPAGSNRHEPVLKKNIEPQRITPELQNGPMRAPYNGRRPLPLLKSTFKDPSDNAVRRVPPLRLDRFQKAPIQNRLRIPMFPVNQANPVISAVPQSSEDILKSMENEKNAEIEHLPFQLKKQLHGQLFGAPGMLHLENKELRPQLFSANPHVIIRQNQLRPPHQSQNSQEMNLKNIAISTNNLKQHNAPKDSHHIHNSTALSTSILNIPQENSYSLNKSLSSNENYPVSSSSEETESEPEIFLTDTSEVADEDKLYDQKKNLSEFSSSNENTFENNTSIEFHLTEEVSDHAIDYEAPFGARLKPRPNDKSKQKVNANPIPKSPINFLRKPQLPSPQVTFSKPSNIENIKPLEESSGIHLPSEPSYIDLLSSIENGESNLRNYTNSNISEVKENKSSQLPEHLYVNKIQDLPSFVETDFISSDNYPGRKHILPSTSNITFTNTPVRAPEDINLPHISEKPPSHDNGTDFSILNHVLYIIGGQTNSGHFQRDSGKETQS
ncbi:uncharacterized protein [Parasteatoda tepidariorum]|uniref:uncharacterized protein isoform X2 n=1 Tax=Parasteatoda tepidariorum TaxID=114398 RepID=UPI001C7284CF|nr:uncharacterized protein LOC107448366 isoform X2 [Parasteatoda tepidariorum]